MPESAHIRRGPAGPVKEPPAEPSQGSQRGRPRAPKGAVTETVPVPFVGRPGDARGTPGGRSGDAKAPRFRALQKTETIFDLAVFPACGKFAPLPPETGIRITAEP